MIEKDDHLGYLKTFQTEEKDYRRKVADEMERLRPLFSDLYHQDTDTLKENLLQKIQFDIESVQAFKKELFYQEKLSSFPLKVSKPVRYNQLPRITQATQKLIEKYFTSLIDTQNPYIEGYCYDYEPEHVTWLKDPDPHAFYGTARVTPLKDAYLRLTLMQEKGNYLHEIERILPKGLNTTILVNRHPLPEDLAHSLSLCTYFDPTSLSSEKHSLIMPHNYYELGGGRAPHDRTQDCSALIIRHITGISLAKLNLPFTTLDLHIHNIITHRNLFTQGSTYFNYLDSYFSEINELLSQYIQGTHLIDSTGSVVIRDPQIDIKPGMIMCTRGIEEKNSEGNQPLIGVKGHTAFVISEPTTHGRFWTAGCERGLLKNKDGIGYSLTSTYAQVKPEMRRITHFFEVKKNTSPQILSKMPHSRNIQP